ncbi:MAG: hypothetical protein L6V93_04580 [Clostridiales bacterium]|nr:MAG: hypothetical protein L6V93_04580 [Clostridiales bacterium]
MKTASFTTQGFIFDKNDEIVVGGRYSVPLSARTKSRRAKALKPVTPPEIHTPQRFVFAKFTTPTKT